MTEPRSSSFSASGDPPVRGSKTVRTDTKRAFYRNPADPRHGTTNGYNNLGCRCEPCRKAWGDDHVIYMHRNPEQRRKAVEREREATALKHGFASREEYEEALRPFLLECPFCDWKTEVPASWGTRGRDAQYPRYTGHIRRSHPPKVSRV